LSPGLSSDSIERARNFKIITEVQQDGQNFTLSQHYSGGNVITNKFTIGKESEIQTMGGKKFKVSEGEIQGRRSLLPPTQINFSISSLFPKLMFLSEV
jgi:hypothetical protein